MGLLATAMAGLHVHDLGRLGAGIQGATKNGPVFFYGISLWRLPSITPEESI